MEEFWLIIIAVLVASGGSCTLAGTWWQKHKNSKSHDDECLKDEYPRN